MTNSRRGKIPEYLKEAYTPEYMRLNRDPEPQEISREDLMSMQSKRRRPVQPQPQQPQQNFGRPKGIPIQANINKNVPSFSTEPQRTSKLRMGATVPNPNPQAQQPPPQMPVHVGSHEDQMWFSDEVTGEQFVDNNKEIDTDNLQGYDPLAQMHDAHAATDENAWVASAEPDPEPEPEPSSNNEETQPGEYILSYNGQHLLRSTSIDEIRSMIDKLLINYENVQLEHIELYKRLPVNFGIIID